MIKLTASSHIYFNHPEHGHVGWNNVVNLINPLGARFLDKFPHASDTALGKFIAESLAKLRTTGYLSPEETLGETWWIVEKTIPFDIRSDFRKDRIGLTSILKQLKV